MKKVFLPLLASSLAFDYSCSNKKFSEPLVAPEPITKSLMDFLVYRQKYLRLAEDFTAVDSAENSLDRGAFLQRLSTGRYLPARLQTKDSANAYQLVNTSAAAEDIRTTIGQ